MSKEKSKGKINLLPNYETRETISFEEYYNRVSKISNPVYMPTALMVVLGAECVQVINHIKYYTETFKIVYDAIGLESTSMEIIDSFYRNAEKEERNKVKFLSKKINTLKQKKMEKIRDRIYYFDTFENLGAQLGIKPRTIRSIKETLVSLNIISYDSVRLNTAWSGRWSVNLDVLCLFQLCCLIFYRSATEAEWKQDYKNHHKKFALFNCNVFFDFKKRNKFLLTDCQKRTLTSLLKTYRISITNDVKISEIEKTKNKKYDYKKCAKGFYIGHDFIAYDDCDLCEADEWDLCQKLNKEYTEN